MQRLPRHPGPGCGGGDVPQRPLAVGGRLPAKVKMEEILRKLQKEASGSKYKAIKESCTWALGKRTERGAGVEHLPVGPARRRRCRRRAARAGAAMATLRGGFR